jgi:DUF4097 and DUF4098 domain-containing protein YvlB
MPKNATYRQWLRRCGGLFAVLIVLVVVTVAAALPNRLRITKMGGDVDVADVPDGGSIKTMGGNVHVGKVHNDISINTMGGNIDIDSADASVDAKTMGGNIEATLVKGDPGAAHSITLSSMGGEIILILPKEYPMTIDVELAYTKNQDNKYRISESLGLDESATTSWDYLHGSGRKYLYAKGKVGNGRNHVAIKTVNGDIIIKGERSQL